MSVIAALALVVSVMGLVVALLAASVAQAPAAGVAAMLELWMAAGILKLQDAPTCRALAATAAVMALRKLLSTRMHRRSKQREHTLGHARR